MLAQAMKNPGQKIGNDIRCEMPPRALKIIQAWSREVGEDEIFPYSNGTLSCAFTGAGALLGIEGLHIHDVWHKAMSRLFESGRSLPQAASVSGHRSWSSLRRSAESITGRAGVIAGDASTSAARATASMGSARPTEAGLVAEREAPGFPLQDR